MGLTAGWDECRVDVHRRPVVIRTGPEVRGSVPLVHVHGFAISGSYLLPTARALAHRATTFVPDLPGYGKSASWGHALGIPSLAWVLLEILDALALERVVLVVDASRVRLDQTWSRSPTAPERKIRANEQNNERSVWRPRGIKLRSLVGRFRRSGLALQPVGELQTGTDAHLRVDVADVELDGLDADRHIGGDLPVAHAGGHPGSDCQLLAGETGRVEVASLARGQAAAC